MLNDAALVIGANAIDAAITHVQAHNADPGADGVGAEIGGRTAVNGTVDADGDIAWSNVGMTGLGANAAFWGVSYWTAASGGQCLGVQARTTGDATANSSGAYTWSGTENSTSS